MHLVFAVADGGYYRVAMKDASSWAVDADVKILAFAVEFFDGFDNRGGFHVIFLVVAVLADEAVQQ